MVYRIPMEYIQGEVISTIRAVDTTHTIIVGASDYNIEV